MLPFSIYRSLSASQNVGNQPIDSARSEWIASLVTIAASDPCQLNVLSVVQVIVIYDHLVSVSGEVQHVWGRVWSSVNVLYYVNRWTALVWACFNVAVLFPVESYKFVYPVFAAIRVYAVSHGNLVLPCAVFATAEQSRNICIPFRYTLDIEPHWFNQLFPNISVTGGIQNVFASGSKRTQLVDCQPPELYAAPACCIIAETIVLSVTLFKAYISAVHIRSKRSRSPIMQSVLVGGVLWFLAILVLNMFAMFATVSKILKYASLFTVPLNSVIISRFLLNLRTVASDSVDNSLETKNPSFIRHQSTTKSTESSMRFASVVGNMGEPLRTGFDIIDDEDVVGRLHDHDRVAENKTVRSSLPLSPLLGRQLSARPLTMYRNPLLPHAAENANHEYQFSRGTYNADVMHSTSATYWRQPKIAYSSCKGCRMLACCEDLRPRKRLPLVEMS
ncbi:hypothetical protein CERSUDRAFT_70198 [Gelatoporia subvermispora B]|uniref:DUF6533 domain-containing protein n=1 Tax=Ceriporiopsis subvermispora (strain B) TaxID=914234 RepID=M2RS09_CERS8|nr:hypothetical protein CERSUDRAFT_70198 [Gelatoporia subvermispora B]